MNRWLWVPLAVVVTAAISIPIAWYFAPMFELECHRPSPERVDCVVMITRRTSVRTLVLDNNALKRAEVHESVHIDKDGQSETYFYLRLRYRDGATDRHVDSPADSRDAHRARVAQIDRFLAQPGERALLVRHDSRRDAMIIAIFMPILAGLVTAAMLRS